MFLMDYDSARGWHGARIVPYGPLAIDPSAVILHYAMPGIPYTVDRRGFGPAWSNCLFENNAEFSLGMFLSVRQQRAAERMP